MDISIFGRKMSIVKHKECSAILSRVTLVGLLFFFFGLDLAVLKYSICSFSDQDKI
jgi:hypothetical protein